MKTASCLFAGLALVLALAFAVPAAGAPRDPAFWRDIVKKDYAVPAGASAFGLIQELDDWTGSPDPELRDDLAFTLTAVWITYRPSVSSEQLIALLDRWRPGLMRGLQAGAASPSAAASATAAATGAPANASGAARATGAGGAGSDDVLGRSFTALKLAVLAERDLTAPYLGTDRYHRLLDDALAYLRAETDLRGYESGKGWFHATAHTADLLKYLARNPLLTPADQARILDGVSARLASAPLVFTHGEQDRLAQTLVSIVRRDDFDAAGFTAWVTKMREVNAARLKTRPLEPAVLNARQNDLHLMEALFARLSRGELAAPAVAARAAVLEFLPTR